MADPAPAPGGAAAAAAAAAAPYLGRKVRVALAGVPAAGAAAEAPPQKLEADLFALDGHHGLAVFRNPMAQTFMKADYFFLPLSRILAWEDLGEGEKVVVASGVAESVLRQRYEASRKREEELIECRSEHASELELRLFMELRKTCVGLPRGAQPAACPRALTLPTASFFSPSFCPARRHQRAKWQGRTMVLDDQGTLLREPYAEANLDTSSSSINEIGVKFLLGAWRAPRPHAPRASPAGPLNALPPHPPQPLLQSASARRAIALAWPSSFSSRGEGTEKCLLYKSTNVPTTRASTPVAAGRRRRRRRRRRRSRPCRRRPGRPGSPRAHSPPRHSPRRPARCRHSRRAPHPCPPCSPRRRTRPRTGAQCPQSQRYQC